MRSHPFLRPVLPSLLSLGGALLGCNSVPTGPPEEVAPRIVALLDSGKTEDAQDLFDAAARGDGRERLYPLLYETARGRFERGEASGSTAVLRFMAQEYEKSAAVREALVYALFLQRAALEKPTPALLEETGAALAKLRANATEVPPWIELVQAQDAIDRGELRAAREAFARFRQSGQESPPELVTYVHDIDRYLSSHSGGTTP